MRREVNEFADNERYSLRIESIEEEARGLEQVFLHLDVRVWDKTTLKYLRFELEDILEKARFLGLGMVSFYVDKEVTTKFHNLVRPLDFEREVEGHENHVVGGWFT